MEPNTAKAIPAAAPQSQNWEAAVGRGESCLRASARRYRVVAQNAPRAALSALRRHGLSTADAQEANVHIAIYSTERERDEPLAVFAVGGTVNAPCLCLRFARMQVGQEASEVANAAVRLGGELRRAARRRAEAELGQSGLREVLNDRFWEREISLYTGTALFLAAFGFPMSLGVFVVGGIVLLAQGAIRLTWKQLRLSIRTARLAGDPALQQDLRESAVRAAFAARYGVNPDAQPRGRGVMKGELTVPDLHGDNALHLFLDEGVVATVGGIGPQASAYGDPAEGNLPDSDNVLTVVFRRLRRPKPKAEEAEKSAAEQKEEAKKPDLDDIGREALGPGKVDVDDIGSRRALRSLRGKANAMLPSPASARDSTRPREEDEIEVIDAEIVEEDFEPQRHNTGRLPPQE